MSRTQLNCNPGNYQCGGRCLSNKLKCHNNSKATSINKLLDSSSNLIKRAITEERTYYNSLPLEKKEERIKHPDISNELLGWSLNSYFTPEYFEINRFFYDGDYIPNLDIQMKALALKNNFSQLKEYSIEEIKDHYKERGVNYDGKTLYRGMSNNDPDFFNNFINSHSNVGSTIEYPSFTSTSMANPNDSINRKVDGAWGSKPIQIKIIQKDNTAGRWVDNYKKSKDEAEILYPPGQKFKVLSIEKEERPKLDPIVREPLQKIFKSTEEGFGIKGLTLGEALGGMDTSVLLNNREFSWLKDLLKKRGLPSPLNNNLKLGEILSLSKFKGGKSNFYDLLSKSLLNTIGSNSTEMEIFGAKILLEEI